ncbi:flavin reductase [Dyella sp. C11]|uniref:flavin reductase n=1 Tax=Dyella sp. C11 TaxID=2126991 RepID=UPI000D6522D0|nr:flavin reductase [Dyella sp. C11]
MWKDWIRPLVRPLPQWSTIAMAPPQAVVGATLRWEGGIADVTNDHTVASLKPLVVATSIDAGLHPTLEYRDSTSGKLIGALKLSRMASVVSDGASVAVYHVVAGEHRCLGWPRRPWNAWLQNRLMLKHPSAQHALMAPSAVQQLMIAYLCPRPVVLVSVDTEDHRNMFPMDLIGPLGHDGLFSLALRSTNVSATVMLQSRRVALSSIPAAMKATVYKLSEHHRLPLTDWQSLPLAVRPSRTFGIPVVADALRVHELAIEHAQEIGSHTFFLGRIVSEERRVDGHQLHHTPGFHQVFRRRHHAPFAEI